MVRVEALGPDDWETTRDLRLAALLNAPEAFGGTYEETAKRTEADWRAWPKNGQVFAARIDDEPVGMACGWQDPEKPDVTALIGMWVAPKARGGSVAKALIDAVAQWARERDSQAIELTVYESNVAGRRAYLKHGFADTGPSLEYANALNMRLDLS
ncbi:MAG TPA: GNAT family N-acetyltransferase [Micromonosporaceae bacterium]|nr:GNAT family N-acetyltransferase [Micromonosporaceae bacterium]